MKTGVIITSNSFTRKDNVTNFDDISVNYVHVKGEDWRQSDNEKGVNIRDMAHYMELMAEGIALAVEFLAQKGVDTERNLLDTAKERIDIALFKVAKLSESNVSQDYTGKEIKLPQ